MYWDRFDICEAWYLALSHCHGGQYSKEYSRLSTMKTRLDFRPSPILDTDTLSRNGLEIYFHACESILGEALIDELELVTEWETSHSETF